MPGRLNGRPADGGRATVRFTVRAQISLGGQDLPVFDQGAGSVQWLVITEIDGHWYVDLSASAALPFVGPCP